ncbi:potassium-transporting ATPase subunit KdpA [Pseudonocardia acidicola]|uniref:Potassium-transporting ATPase potassium-binding subunit n=1 Tax=Pseudonocardia acidicola TaxID=2724939 RepID=A0ABX1SBA5_9PSEU|nr:potassium-transporting ATPase subunit KdpA [Pseudonocardia acidicola]NMH97773.1 potassium-transporting ATPase subunit KdpA [Pseudonocardia acidicola]
MSPAAAAWLQAGGLAVALAGTYWLLGDHLARVLTSTRHLRVERLVYRGVGVDPETDQTWAAYLRALLAFSVVSMLFLYGLQRVQPLLPLSLGRPPVPPDLAFDVGTSFLTNANWQSYAGESTMGQFVQMAGLATQNFAAAAVGITVSVALIRGFRRVTTAQVGNFWVDFTRVLVRVLLPAAFAIAIVLVARGVIQNFQAPQQVATLVGGRQSIPGGPVASQEAIKQLGTNGGGYFNANSAHPYENPDPVTNWVQIYAMLAIPVALPRTFGVMVADRRQGHAIAAVMAVLFAGSAALLGLFESTGGLEGKEVRFGSAGSALFAAAATATSGGAANSSYDSFSPLGGGTALANMMLGEVAPGGVGSGLYGMLILAILTVFLAGLMVGRTPEYLGKKITGREVKFASLYILTTPALVLVGAAVAIASPAQRAAIGNPGAHGFTEVLYAFTSTANSNGSAFAGLAADTTWYNTVLGCVMLLGRFAPIVFVLALAGSLAAQRPVPETTGTLPTHRPLFIGMVLGVVLIVVALTYFPAFALGPLAEGLRP